MEKVIGVVLLRPFVALVVLLVAAVIAWPIRRAVYRLPEGRLKRLLLIRWDISTPPR
jgi:hypothetical protein